MKSALPGLHSVALVLALQLCSAPAAAQERPSLEDLQAQIDTVGGWVSGRVVVQSQGAVDTASSKTHVVACPPGHGVLGGGGRMVYVPGSGNVGQTLSASYPNSASSWQVSARAPVATPDAWAIVVYAVCAPAAP